MELDYSLPNILILLGALQGIIFAASLLLRKKHKSHLFLGIFMFSLSYNAFETFAAVSGLGNQIVFFGLFSFTVIFLLGPSFYLYIKSILFPENGISKKALALHYILPTFQFSINLFLISAYLLNSTQTLNIDWDFMRLYGLFDTYSEPLSIIVFSVYVLKAFKLFKQARGVEKQLAYPNTSKSSILHWTKILLIATSFFSLVWALIFILPFLTANSFTLGYYPIELTLIFFIYWISFAANQKMQLVDKHLQKSKQSLISQAEASLKIAQLQGLMLESKLYLDPKVTREKLAKEAKVSPRTISAILNQYHGQSFNDFINSYRIEEVKTQLHSSKIKKQTITGIAFDAGFNSQATFQRVFKNTVGMSPKEYAAQAVESTVK